MLVKAFMVSSFSISEYNIDIFFKDKDKRRFKTALIDKKYKYIDENNIIHESTSYNCILRRNINKYKKNKRVKNEITSLINRYNGWIYVRIYELNIATSKIIIDILDLEKKSIVSQILEK